MSTIHRDLQDQRRMMQDAIDEGSPMSKLLQQKVDEIDAKLALTAKLPDQQSETADEATDGSRPHRRPQGGAPAANQFGTFTVAYASPPQVKFIKKLLAERDISGLANRVLTIPTNDAEAEKVNRKHASAVIDALLAAPKKGAAAGAPATRPNGPSPAQLDLLRRLLAEHVLDEVTAPFKAADIEQLTGGRGGQASAFIDYLTSQPRFRDGNAQDDLAIGIYQVGEKIYKVYPNQSDTRMLAKLLVLPEGWMKLDREQRTAWVAENGQDFWSYQGMANRFVKAEHKMSIEAAQAFGKITSVCSQCGRLLTKESSIEQGMGDWCAKNGGW